MSKTVYVRYGANKVFVIGLHRVGTQSLNRLFETAGLRSVHWPTKFAGVDVQEHIRGRELDRTFIVKVLKPLIKAHDAVSDVPICGIYEELAQAYPAAKFVALTRSPAKWLQSVRRHIGGRPFDPFERCLYWKYFPDQPQTLEELSDTALMWMFTQHYAAVFGNFAEKYEVCALDLEHPEVGERVCSFVGLEPRPLPRIDYLAPIAPAQTKSEALRLQPIEVAKAILHGWNECGGIIEDGAATPYAEIDEGSGWREIGCEIHKLFSQSTVVVDGAGEADKFLTTRDLLDELRSAASSTEERFDNIISLLLRIWEDVSDREDSTRTLDRGLADMLVSLDTLAASLAATKEEAKIMSAHLAEAQATRQADAASLEESKRMVEALHEELSAAAERHELLRSALQEADNRAEGFVNQVKRLQKALDDKDEALQQSEVERRWLTSNMKRLENGLADLATASEQQEAAHRQMTEKLLSHQTILLDQLARLESQSSEQDKRIVSFIGITQEQQAQISMLDAMLDASVKERDRLSGEHISVVNRCEQLMIEIQSTNQRHKAVKEDSEAMRRMLERSRTDLANILASKRY